MIAAGNGFAGRYAEARSRWLAAVARRGGRVESVEHGAQRGPEGEHLSMDWASFGDVAAQRVFVIACGTHGIEGYAGSAVLSAWLEAHAPALPAGAKLVLVHAVNPWGFAHGQRVTEENVDLNRNFLDAKAFESRALPSNPGYAALHETLMLPDWDEAAIAHVFAALDAYRQREGEKAFSDAFNGGQYTNADGLFFGGQRPQWSHQAWREGLRRHVGAAREVHLLDLHTGIGPYGEPFFINFDAPGTPRRKTVERIWGAASLSGSGSTHAALATYRGLLMDTLAAEWPDRDTSAVVVEFGTHPRPRMQRAHLALAWWRRHPEAPEALRAQARREYADAFVPVDPQWRQRVLAAGVALCERGVRTWAALPS